jgi:hypothetical protein
MLQLTAMHCAIYTVQHCMPVVHSSCMLNPTSIDLQVGPVPVLCGTSSTECAPPAALDSSHVTSNNASGSMTAASSVWLWLIMSLLAHTLHCCCSLLVAELPCMTRCILIRHLRTYMWVIGLVMLYGTIMGARNCDTIPVQYIVHTGHRKARIEAWCRMQPL